MDRPSDYENEQMNKKQRLSLDLPDLSSILEYKLEVTQSHFKWANKKTNKDNDIILKVRLRRTDDMEVDPDIKKKLKLIIYCHNSDHPIEKQKILKVRDPNKLTIYGSNETIIPVRIEAVSSSYGNARFVIRIELENDDTVKVCTDSIYVVTSLKSNKIITNENPSDSNQTTTSTTTVNTINLSEDNSKYLTTVINNQPIQEQTSQQNRPEDDESWLDFLCDMVEEMYDPTMEDAHNHLEYDLNDSTIIDAMIQIECKYMDSTISNMMKNHSRTYI